MVHTFLSNQIIKFYNIKYFQITKRYKHELVYLFNTVILYTYNSKEKLILMF